MTTKPQLLTDRFYMTNYVTDIINQGITMILIFPGSIKHEMKPR